VSVCNGYIVPIQPLSVWHGRDIHIAKQQTKTELSGTTEPFNTIMKHEAIKSTRVL